MSERQILLVDDSAAVRSFVRIHLAGRPLNFVEAEDGQAGLVHAKRTRFDLVILDMRMPKLDGIGFIRALFEANVPFQRPLIVVLTGAELVNEEAEFLARHAAGVLQKPVHRSALIPLVDKLLKFNV